MNYSKVFIVTAAVLLATAARAANRRITFAEYKDKVYGAWIGQIAGTSYGFNFEGKARNAIELNHYLNHYEYARPDDDYYYEMVALYGFERHGIGMTVEQLGDMWKEYKAGTWGSSEQARLALERGIKAPDSGSPRYNRWFQTIGPEFSSDIYGMISPGMVNLAGAMARRYSHVNGYAEGSDGAVFVAACVSEAFFETDPAKILRQAAQLIDPRSNYRKAIDFVLAEYERGKPWREIAAESEARWRPEYPQLNNAVANGALVALGVLFGEGDYLKSINIVTQSGDYTDADCNAANVSSVIGAMHGFKAIPTQFTEPLHNRIYGDHLGPLNLGEPSISESMIWRAASRRSAGRTCSPMVRGSKAIRWSSRARPLRLRISNTSTSTITALSGIPTGGWKEHRAEARAQLISMEMCLSRSRATCVPVSSNGRWQSRQVLQSCPSRSGI